MPQSNPQVNREVDAAPCQWLNPYNNSPWRSHLSRAVTPEGRSNLGLPAAIYDCSSPLICYRFPANRPYGCWGRGPPRKM